MDDLDNFPFDSPEDWPWDEIDTIHAYRDDSGWDISVELSDGTIIDVLDGLDDETAQDLIWEELYYLAMDEGVDFYKDVEYAAD